MDDYNNISRVEFMSFFRDDEKLNELTVDDRTEIFRNILFGSSDFLVASHIFPWEIDENNCLNPLNGLCLNSIHDRAFDHQKIILPNRFLPPKEL